MAYKDPHDPRLLAKRREHYYDNKEAYKQRAKAAKAATAQWVTEYKESRSCMDCGEFYPAYVMDFDHRDATIKVSNVAKLLGYGLKRVKEEIEKCDLVCANCHRVRTHKRIIGVSVG